MGFSAEGGCAIGASPIKNINMSHVKILTHTVWGTKSREPVLLPTIRTAFFHHILENAKEKNIFIDTIGGYNDHIHCLISLGTDQTIGKVVQLIKGESSHWANESKMFKNKFEWGEDYFAASVSVSSVEKVRQYIKNQEDHHRTVSFAEEYQRFVESCGLQLG
jgi:REP element-mobilizing transposase RayT